MRVSYFKIQEHLLKTFPTLYMECVISSIFQFWYSSMRSPFNYGRVGHDHDIDVPMQKL